MVTKRHDEAIGSQAVVRSTGRPREEWHELLDTAGATGWPHKRIAEWLVTEHAVDGWWAQSLTVGYEQARGMRQPGQRPDGTFDANVSRTVAAGVQDVSALVSDDARVAAWVGEGWHVASSSPGKRARLESDDGSRALIELTAVSAEKSRVAVQHMRLPDSEAVGEWKAFWKDALGRLVAQLG